MATLEVSKQIPDLTLNEQSSFTPINFREYFTAGLKLSIEVQFDSLKSLPQGLVLEDGILSGKPRLGSAGNYLMQVIARNDEGDEVACIFNLMIKSTASLQTDNLDYINQLKTQIWQALHEKKTAPQFSELVNARQVSMADVYYMIERFAPLIIWDAMNLEGPSQKILLNLEGASPHFNVYDRGNSIVSTPKELFSHERTLNDALQTAKAMAREVYRRGWVVEFAGFEKLERAVWVELQHLEDIHGKKLEVLHYDASSKDFRIYLEQAKVFAQQRLADNP